MMRLLFVVVAALFLSTRAEEEPTVCLTTLAAQDLAKKYHHDGLCNKTHHNSDEKRALRERRYMSLKPTGVSHIPNQLTVVCPIEPIQLEPAHGHDTKWIVINKSSQTAVVAFIGKNGVEYSANNPTITPPQSDPESLLKPGEWMALETFEGHVFHVRELRGDGSLGNILLQHRPGLVGFTNRFHQELDCSDYHDQEPVVEVKPKTITPKRKLEAPQPTKIKTDPKFRRTPESRHESCNTIYQGFRNTLPNCPLHIYYAGQRKGINDDEVHCKEHFKFHLGLEDTTKDYMNVWDDRTKFESTYMGHSFVARLAKDPTVLVDYYNMVPTEIHDCPSLKQKPIVAQQVIQAEGIQGGVGNELNATRLEGTVNTTRVVVEKMRAAAGSE